MQQLPMHRPLDWHFRNQVGSVKDSRCSNLVRALEDVCALLVWLVAEVAAEAKEAIPEDLSCAFSLLLSSRQTMALTTLF